MPDSLPIPTNMPSTLTGSVAGPSSLNKDKENEKEKDKGHAILRRRRPSPPPRQPSYSKRHASFDSPREVPLPSPSLQAQSGQAEFSYFDVPLKSPRSPRKAGTTQQAHPLTRDKEKDFFSPVFEDIEGSEWTSVDKPPSPALSLSQNSNSQKQSALNPPTSGPSSHLYETYSTLGMLPANSQQIHPFPRPYSLPHSSSSGSSGSVICPEGESNDETGGPSRLGRSKTEEGLDIYSRDQIGLGTSGWDSFGNVDRASSASLPLPSQIPYHALPRVGEHHKLDFGRLRGLVGEVARSKVPEVSVEEGGKSQPEASSSSSSSGRSSTDTLPSTSHSLSPSPPRTVDAPSFRSPPPYLSGPQHNPNIPNVHAFHSPRSADEFSSARTSAESRQRIDALVEATAHATALRRRPPSSHSNSSTSPFNQPPEPPIILPPPSPPPNMGVMSSSASQRSADSHESATTQLPPPQPIPKITNPNDLPPVLPPSRTRRSVPGDFLTGSAAESTTSAVSSSASSTLSYPGAASLDTSSLSAPGALGQTSAVSRASSPHSNQPPPYAPFLSHMPPPADSWIQVETKPSEYRLNIRLPGFKRDGITLSTKRRRILHIVADSWPDPDPSPRGSNPNSSESSTTQRGGHFERRISFGYDADLVGVRAEFDGEMLKIVVPRRQGMAGGMAPFL